MSFVVVVVYCLLVIVYCLLVIVYCLLVIIVVVYTAHQPCHYCMSVYTPSSLECPTIVLPCRWCHVICCHGDVSELLLSSLISCVSPSWPCLLKTMIKIVSWAPTIYIHYYTVHGKMLAGENFGEPYRWSLLIRKDLANKLQSVYMPYTFPCICEYWWGKFWRMAHNSPNSSIFPLPNFPVYL